MAGWRPCNRPPRPQPDAEKPLVETQVEGNEGEGDHSGRDHSHEHREGHLVFDADGRSDGAVVLRTALDVGGAGATAERHS